MGLVLETLRSVDFLAAAQAPLVERFMALGTTIEVEKGHVFWTARTEPKKVVIPISADAEAVVLDTGGREHVDRFVGPGECLGLMSALDGLQQSHDARALGAGEFFVIGRSALLRFLDEEPEICAHVMTTVGRLYRRSLGDREALVMRPVTARVAAFLLEHACVRQSDGARILLWRTQHEIAARLGTVREVVARAFANLDSRGIVARTAHGIFIADWAALRAEAGVDARDDRSGTGRESGPSAQLRTSRFFISAHDGGSGGVDNGQAAVCLEHLPDLAACCARGCPVALASQPLSERRLAADRAPRHVEQRVVQPVAPAAIAHPVARAHSR